MLGLRSGSLQAGVSRGAIEALRFRTATLDPVDIAVSTEFCI